MYVWKRAKSEQSTDTQEKSSMLTVLRIKGRKSSSQLQVSTAQKILTVQGYQQTIIFEDMIELFHY